MGSQLECWLILSVVVLGVFHVTVVAAEITASVHENRVGDLGVMVRVRDEEVADTHILVLFSEDIEARADKVRVILEVGGMACTSRTMRCHECLLLSTE